MRDDGALDLLARRLLDWHIAEGSDGIEPSSAPRAKSPTVDFAEHCQLIETTVQHVADRVPTTAGTGANATREAIELASFAKQAGADAHLCRAVLQQADAGGAVPARRRLPVAVDLPMIVYNVPGRTVADLSNDTALRLVQVPGIVGIKDATGDIERGTDLLKRAPKNFMVYSGDDATAMVLMLLGGMGTISVTANVAPRLMHEMCGAALQGDLLRARELNFRWLAPRFVH